MHSITEIALSIGLGSIFGIALCYLLTKCASREEVLGFITGILLLLIGACTIFNLSALLTAMTMGTVVDTINEEFMKKPGTGVMFVMPVPECYGLRNEEYENH